MDDIASLAIFYCSGVLLLWSIPIVVRVTWFLSTARFTRRPPVTVEIADTRTGETVTIAPPAPSQKQTPKRKQA